MPAWAYWEPVETPVVAVAVDSVSLPLALAELVAAPGIERRWIEAPVALRDAVATRGFAVARLGEPMTHLGDLYESLQSEQVPWVVTLDTLFFLVHLALDRALAEVDAYVLAPATATMLHRLDANLMFESRAASADLVRPYVEARGLVEVALALAEPTYGAPADLAQIVMGERERVLAHAGIEMSEWLGVPIDYGAMCPVGLADRDDWHAGWFRAFSWLQGVPLALMGTGEGQVGAFTDIATAREHARAALLLARLLGAGVDAEAAGAWNRVERASELVVGDADDVTLGDLSAAAERIELDIRNPAWLANVVSVDRVRRAAARARTAPAVHLFGRRATPDGELLQALTSPRVGPQNLAEARDASASPTHPSAPITARDGKRALPTGLDVAAWLGSGEARAMLHDSGDDAYAGYDDAIDRLMRDRPPDIPLGSPGRHRTPYLSLIDAIETWLGPSEGDRVQPGASTSEWRKRKAEVSLAAWTELRHEATALTRIPVTEVRLPARAFAPVMAPAFVEPHPEAIAKLCGLVRQTRKALVTEGALRSGSPAIRVLDEVDDVLWTALGAAVYETADEPLPPELDAALAAFPARIHTLEAALADSGVADVPLVVGVHVDQPSGRMLMEAIGRVDEAWMVMREPGTHRLWIALGASIPHYELVQSAAQCLSDSAWRARLEKEGEPPPDGLTSAYVIAPPGSVP